jgi:uncharacterized protein (TIGR02757 family)
MALRPLLDDIYLRFNRAEFIDPDPLAPVLRYSEPEDQELVGLIAASLAFGNVKQILVSIERVLTLLPSPRATLCSVGEGALRRGLRGFRHRYAGEDEMAALLLGARAVIQRHGSLGASLRAHACAEDADVIPALAGFSHELRSATGLMKNYLLCDASKGSANKRWCMYLRWMLRRDAVDPGPWHGVMPASMLVVPIDTHMHRFCNGLGLTRRKAADMRTAQEVSAAFRLICPEDPARYDFAITRLGIRRENDAAAALLEAARALRRVATTS